MYPIYNRKITLNIKMNDNKYERDWLWNAMIYSPSLSISLDVHWIWINWQRHCHSNFIVGNLNEFYIQWTNLPR